MQVSIFKFEKMEIRTVMHDGEPWFVATDVAKILGYIEAKDMTRNLDDDEKGRRIVPTPGGDQEVLIINEPGLYRAVFLSQKDEAVLFKRWVFHVVLPAIRKTGEYNHAEYLKTLPTVLETIEATLVDARNALHDLEVKTKKARNLLVPPPQTKAEELDQVHSLALRHALHSGPKSLSELIAITGMNIVQCLAQIKKSPVRMAPGSNPFDPTYLM